MASRTVLCLLFLGGLQAIVAAPTLNKTLSLPARPAPFPITPGSRLLFEQRPRHGPDAHINEVDSLLLAPPTESSASPAGTTIIPNDSQYPFSFSYMTSAPSSSFAPIAELTITEEVTTTITVPATPTTVTETVTVTETASPTAPSSAPMPSAGPIPGQIGPSKAIWEAPANLTDLDSFQVSKYASGSKNMKIVTGIPASASASPLAAAAADGDSGAGATRWDNATSVLQILYPAGTIDPAQSPVGGADFYAAPLDIDGATSVTLSYSVFVPADFDWVRGGKMPGLYGGHTGCSGGNSAIDCFSTRLMWRAGGAGELYLYAPKDKQTKALCGDPRSVCDAAYGLSVGRGTFQWTAGAWTKVEQTVILNTPGQQDGTFVLLVNGERKIARNDVFYRADLSGGKGGADAKPTRAPSRTTAASREGGKATPTATTPTDDGGPLGPLLGGIIDGLGLRRDVRGDLDSQMSETGPNPAPATPAAFKDSNAHLAMAAGALRPLPQATNTSSSGPALAEMDVDADDPPTVGAESVSKSSASEVKLIGIFFSTFFGGHEPEYATPRDQYVWFKDFALAHNS